MAKEHEHAIERTRQRYDEQYGLRAMVQLIPYIGGPLDTLIAGGAKRLQYQRIEEFINDLNMRLSKIENPLANPTDDDFIDLMLNTFDGVARSSSRAKRSRFASIIGRQIAIAAPWDEAQNAIRLLSGLEDIHLEVLRVALDAPPFQGAFEGKPVVCLGRVRAYDPSEDLPVLLPEVLPHHKPHALEMACAELSAKGLLHDEGVGRWDVGAMNYFVITDLALWFRDWLSISASDSDQPG